jgi:predicted N-acetyltransferase YhbS
MKLIEKDAKTLTGSEKSAIKYFLNSCFSNITGYSESIFPKADLETCVLLESSNEIIAYVGIVRRQIAINDKKYSVGGIADVAVKTSERGRGVGNEIMKHANDVLKKNNFDLGLLFCTPDLGAFYERNGCIKKAKGRIYFNENGRECHESTSYLLPLKVKDEGLKTWFYKDIRIGEGGW